MQIRKQGIQLQLVPLCEQCAELRWQAEPGSTKCSEAVPPNKPPHEPPEPEVQLEEVTDIRYLSFLVKLPSGMRPIDALSFIQVIASTSSIIFYEAMAVSYGFGLMGYVFWLAVAWRLRAVGVGCSCIELICIEN